MLPVDMESKFTFPCSIDGGLEQFNGISTERNEQLHRFLKIYESNYLMAKDVIKWRRTIK